MKKLFILTILGSLALSSCSDLDFDSSRAELIKENAENVFGIIDPKQNWSSTKSGTVTITADANLYDVERVQILTETPFLNSDPTVLAEAEVQKGQTVTLSYDAPNLYTRLIAACIDSNGHYFIKGFNTGEETVSFSSSSATRAAVTRADEYNISPSDIKMEYKNSTPSYNALRTQLANKAAAGSDQELKDWVSKYNINIWQGRNWEDERLWLATNNSNTGSKWTVRDNTVMRDIDNIAEEQKSELEDIFEKYLWRRDANSTWGRVDNLSKIREGNAVKFYNNHLTSDGTTPITIIPVQMASSEIGSCHLYYYYFDPADIAGMSSEEELNYYKRLPKFKAIQCWTTRSEANKRGFGEEDFFKIHEYMLPYYGEPEVFQNADYPMTTGGKYETDGKAYRIRNGRQVNGEDYYMTYLQSWGDDRLATKYADDDEKIDFQLWQIFTDSQGNSLIYNIGAKVFFVFNGSYNSMWATNINTIEGAMFRIDGNTIYRYNDSNKTLGTDLGIKNNLGVWTDKVANTANTSWYFEELVAKSSVAESKAVFGDSPIAAQSLAIPAGYRIGFMLRKLKGSQSYNGNAIIAANNNGCCYGTGGLNREINNFPGHFISSKEKFSMQDDDPRACYINANGRTYIAFEDGSDAQFSDMIIEVGGYDKTVAPEPPVGCSEDKSSGIETNYLYDEKEIEGASYMLCFEDRALSADYDMNDVVLRCKRQKGNPNCVELSLVAAGGNDNVIIRGINGTYKKGYVLHDQEVHEIFDVETLDGEDRFVNTVVGREYTDPCKGVYELPEGLTIPQFLAGIYIQNMTTGDEIHVAQTGEAPLGIILPFNFPYPMEHQSITQAYSLFLNWARKSTSCEDWYNYMEEDKVFPVNELLR